MKWLRTLGPLLGMQFFLLLVVAVASSWQLGKQERRKNAETAQQEILNVAGAVSLATPDLPTDSPSSDWREFANRANNRTNTRITVINTVGVVLADSSIQAADQLNQLETHKQRIEIVQAAKAGEGSAIRQSATLGQEMVYGAVKSATPTGDPIFVRAAVPATSLGDASFSATPFIGAVAILGAFNACMFAVAIYRLFATPIAKLEKAAKADPLKGEPERVYFGEQHLLADVGESFNEMSLTVSTRHSELKDAHERLASVLAGLSDGVLAVDHRERILLANKTAREFLHIPPGDLNGRLLVELVRIHALQELLTEAKQNETAAAEFEFGEPPRRFAVHASRVVDQQTHGVVVVIRDISELRRLEQMRQTFIANVSHELKTPLAAIKGFAETLAGGALHDDNINMRFLGRIEEQADLLNSLVLDMIALSRVQSGEQSFEIVDVPVLNVVQQCVLNQQEAAAAKGVSLQIEEGPATSIRADEEAVRQILQNLIDNAVKYTPSGGSITVGWQALNNNVQMSVVDTGVGIAKEHQKRVFERFYRVDKARSRELGGTGLGLSIVKNLVISFGGSVNVESETGQGSRFSVTLPAGE